MPPRGEPAGEASAPTAGVAEEGGGGATVEVVVTPGRGVVTSGAAVSGAAVAGAAVPSAVDAGGATSCVLLGVWPGAGAGVEVSVERITTTTRRLLLRPSGVSLVCVGR